MYHKIMTPNFLIPLKAEYNKYNIEIKQLSKIISESPAFFFIKDCSMFHMHIPLNLSTLHILPSHAQLSSQFRVIYHYLFSFVINTTFLCSTLGFNRRHFYGISILRAFIKCLSQLIVIVIFDSKVLYLFTSCLTCSTKYRHRFIIRMAKAVLNVS